MSTESSAVTETITAPVEAAQTAPAPEASKEQVVAASDVKSSAESSGAGEGVKEKAPSMLDAVKEAMKKPSDSAKKEATEESPDSKAEVKDGDASKVETKTETEEPPPFAKHPRWQEKLKQERELKKKVSTYEAENLQIKQELERVKTESTAHKQIVDQFTAFQGAVRSAGLNPKEVDDGFSIMRLMKSDPAAALAKLTPYVEALQSFTGAKLPADLQQKVSDGVVDEETARQLAQTRSRANWLEDQGRKTQAQREREAAEADERATQQAVNEAATAVTTWENDWKKADPDYSKKHPLVEAEVIRLMRAEGFPKSPKEAVALSEKARKNVESTLGAILPRKTEVRTVTGGSSAKSAQPRPSSLRDAIAAAATRGA